MDFLPVLTRAEEFERSAAKLAARRGRLAR
jgi:hypothetical protein